MEQEESLDCVLRIWEETNSYECKHVIFFHLKIIVADQGKRGQWSKFLSHLLASH